MIYNTPHNLFEYEPVERYVCGQAKCSRELLILTVFSIRLRAVNANKK